MAIINRADAVKDFDKARAFGVEAVFKTVYRDNEDAAAFAMRVKRERYEKAVTLVQTVYDRLTSDPYFIIKECELQRYVDDICKRIAMGISYDIRKIEREIKEIGKYFT